MSPSKHDYLIAEKDRILLRMFVGFLSAFFLVCFYDVIMMVIREHLNTRVGQTDDAPVDKYIFNWTTKGVRS